MNVLIALLLLASTAQAEHFAPRRDPHYPISFGSKHACEKRLKVVCKDWGDKYAPRKAKRAKK